MAARFEEVGKRPAPRSLKVSSSGFLWWAVVVVNTSPTWIEAYQKT